MWQNAPHWGLGNPKTSDFTGAFNQAKTREEFMNLIRHTS
jgi:GTP cyclohydrolase I